MITLHELGTPMRRRNFIKLLAGTALLGPVTVNAQQSRRLTAHFDEMTTNSSKAMSKSMREALGS
jgi:hypothetical protein